MKEKTDKILTLVMLGLALVAIIFAFIFALDTTANNGMFNIAYWLLVAMIGASILAMVAFLCVKLAARFKDEKGYLKKFLIILGVVVAVVLVATLLSKGNDVPAAMLEKNNVTEATSKWVGAACIMVYILTIGAACAIVFTEVAKAIKKK